ncbi:Tryptophan 2,3-dioxygenase, variant 2 [Parelaphostrongylus tenuis]|uniref:Tryptophan 2,3-dioxygenase, variant 2 n=1 Tax=Parelaphostrongylus tenuis TaxID=148309 RepID=A0AAD5RE36_PARTN|nr:Tryptophan 2,3-dioxygenase, variant 2 [Parelaphostrongylus tenuis]
MACPFDGTQVAFMEMTDEEAQSGVNKVELGQGITYSEYLQLHKLLDCQKLKSEEQGDRVEDEHLFIIIHQCYELWFKQIIYDIDIVRALLNNTVVDETKTLRIVSGLDRTVRILKLLADQITILDTMSPLDFVDFRKYLTTASGFQSLQFRLLENKMGVRPERRIKYNALHYKNVFLNKDELMAIEKSEEEPSLFTLIQNWLERTPGLKHAAVDGEEEEGFWAKYERAVSRYLSDLYEEATKEELAQNVRDQLVAEYYKTKDSFATIIDPKQHAQQILNGTRLLSHDAMKGALMIYFYRYGNFHSRNKMD